jgi:DNA-binding LytR/AlgR family response regulator
MVKELKKENEDLRREKEIMLKEAAKYEIDNPNKKIEISSENYADRLEVLASNLAFIKSADNYVEIAYTEDNTLKKKLLRNTLTNIEDQLSICASFIRCHRICIVNKHFVVRLNKTFNKHWLTLKGTDEEIPVSRQYLLKLREALG